MGSFWYRVGQGRGRALEPFPRVHGCTIARQAWRCLGVVTQIDLCSFWEMLWGYHLPLIGMQDVKRVLCKMQIGLLILGHLGPWGNVW